MADERAPDTPAPKRRSVLRIFLTVAGGLAAPALALAAFFLSNSGHHADPAHAPAVQAGTVTGAAAPARPSAGSTGTAGSTGSAGSAVATTTSTTLAPVPLVPSRDPFVPLVTQAPPGGAPAH
jgi:flagellar basal body-associated protein FliL